MLRSRAGNFIVYVAAPTIVLMKKFHSFQFGSFSHCGPDWGVLDFFSNSNYIPLIIPSIIGFLIPSCSHTVDHHLQSWAPFKLLSVSEVLNLPPSWPTSARIISSIIARIHALRLQSQIPLFLILSPNISPRPSLKINSTTFKSHYIIFFSSITLGPKVRNHSSCTKCWPSPLTSTTTIHHWRVTLIPINITRFDQNHRRTKLEINKIEQPKLCSNHQSTADQELAIHHVLDVFKLGTCKPFVC